MGQYHILYNISKKEYVHAHRIDNGLKLMEQCCWDKSTSTALWLLLANSNGRSGGDAREHQLIGSWAGDNIVIQGDYAKPDDQAFLSEDETRYYKDISHSVKEMLDNEFDY